MLVGGWCFRELGVVVVTSVDNIVEEPVKVCFFLLMSFITAAMCVNSSEKSLDTTVFVASWMVAVDVENNVGVDVSKSPEDSFCTNTPRKGNLSFVGDIDILLVLSPRIILSSFKTHK